MTRSGVNGPEADPDFYEGEVEVPENLAVGALGFWPVREAIDPDFAQNPDLRVAQNAMSAPGATFAEVQHAARLEMKARARRQGQRPEDLMLSLLRAKLVLSVYAWWGRERGRKTLKMVLADYGFSSERALELWARWRKAVPRVLRDRSKEEGRVVTFLGRCEPLPPEHGSTHYFYIDEATRRTVTVRRRFS